MIETFIAFRYLRSGKKSGFAYVVTLFSFIGIALGVATLIIVTSVMNGFRSELLDKIVGMKGHIIITNSDYSDMPNYELLCETIKSKTDEVESIIPQIEQQCILISNGTAKGIMVQGISLESLLSKKLISNNIVAGKISNLKANKVIIGVRLAENLALRIGDSIKLMIPDGLVTPFGHMPKEELFEIAGVFEVGMNEYDKNIIIMNLETAQDFFNQKAKVSQIEIFLNSVDCTSKLTSTLSKHLGKAYRVMDWQHSDSSIFHAVVVEKNVMTLILSIIILVAIFNIISGLTMLTHSKVRDIAILRTMGATKRSIQKTFFIIGSSIGILGTILGIILGLTVSLNIEKIRRFLEKLSGSDLFNEEIYFLSQLPSKTDFVEVAIISIASIVCCLIATWYPARKASLLEPVDALR